MSSEMKQYQKQPAHHPDVEQAGRLWFQTHNHIDTRIPEAPSSRTTSFIRCSQLLVLNYNLQQFPLCPVTTAGCTAGRGVASCRPSRPGQLHRVGLTWVCVGAYMGSGWAPCGPQPPHLGPELEGCTRPGPPWKLR